MKNKKRKREGKKNRNGKRNTFERKRKFLKILFPFSVLK